MLSKADGTFVAMLMVLCVVIAAAMVAHAHFDQLENEAEQLAEMPMNWYEPEIDPDCDSSEVLRFDQRTGLLSCGHDDDAVDGLRFEVVPECAVAGASLQWVAATHSYRCVVPERAIDLMCGGRAEDPRTPDTCPENCVEYFEDEFTEISICFFPVRLMQDGQPVGDNFQEAARVIAELGRLAESGGM